MTVSIILYISGKLKYKTNPSKTIDSASTSQLFYFFLSGIWNGYTMTVVQGKSSAYLLEIKKYKNEKIYLTLTKLLQEFLAKEKPQFFFKFFYNMIFICFTICFCIRHIKYLDCKEQ